MFLVASITAVAASPQPCNRYIVAGAGDPNANGVYTVVSNQLDGIGRRVKTPGLYQLCSTPASLHAAGPSDTADCGNAFQLYSMPAYPAPGKWRIKGWDGRVEYEAANISAGTFVCAHSAVACGPSSCQRAVRGLLEAAC